MTVLILDADIRSILTGYRPRLTAVIHEILVETYPHLTIEETRRTLKQMERSGAIKRVPTSYKRQIAWSRV